MIEVDVLAARLKARQEEDAGLTPSEATLVFTYIDLLKERDKNAYQDKRLMENLIAMLKNEIHSLKHDNGLLSNDLDKMLEAHGDEALNDE